MKPKRPRITDKQRLDWLFKKEFETWDDCGRSEFFPSRKYLDAAIRAERFAAANNGLRRCGTGLT